MRISEELCTGCGACTPYCSVGALKLKDGVAVVEEDECVECGICLRGAGCPTDAIFWPPEVEEWPRLLRKAFSDPSTPHQSTGQGGRGTEEMKTNDVTGRVLRGEIGMALEFGRPSIGTRLGEIEKITTVLAPLGVEFEPLNPLTFLFDTSTGKMRDDVKNERVISAIVEFKTTPDLLPTLIPSIRRVAQTIDTVFSWDLITRVDQGGQIPLLGSLQEMGVSIRPNAKINMGFGRPLAEV